MVISKSALTNKVLGGFKRKKYFLADELGNSLFLRFEVLCLTSMK